LEKRGYALTFELPESRPRTMTCPSVIFSVWAKLFKPAAIARPFFFFLEFVPRKLWIGQCREPSGSVSPSTNRSQ
jgi:hypothetical protein